jgi:hypothetical protein
MWLSILIAVRQTADSLFRGCVNKALVIFSSQTMDSEQKDENLALLAFAFTV